MVQDIEDIRPELHLQLLGNNEILHPGNIPLEVRRAADIVSPDVPKSRRIAPHSVKSRFERKCGDVVARIGPTRIRELQGLVRNAIGPHVIAEEPVGDLNVLRQAGAGLKDAGYLPPAQGLLGQPAGSFQVRQIVKSAGSEVMPRIPIPAAYVQSWIERVGKAREDIDFIVDFVRPRVVGFEREPLVVPAQLRLQCVVF